MPRLPFDQILRYAPVGGPSRSTVRRYYDLWRDARGIPKRCDDRGCAFHTGALVWNGLPLTLILDHVNGVSDDNRPENLRLLCPSCDSQLPTKGGGNRGKVERSAGGFAIRRPDGTRDHTLPMEAARVTISGHAPTVSTGSVKPADRS